MTLRTESEVTAESDTGTSVGLDGTPARIAFKTPLRPSRWVVKACNCRRKAWPSVPTGQLVAEMVFRLGRLRIAGSEAVFSSVVIPAPVVLLATAPSSRKTA